MSKEEDVMATPMEYDVLPMLIRTMDSGGFIRANGSFLKAVRFVDLDHLVLFLL